MSNIREKNHGLVKHVYVSLQKKSIRLFTQTLLTLSLVDVVGKVLLTEPVDV